MPLLAILEQWASDGGWVLSGPVRKPGAGGAGEISILLTSASLFRAAHSVAE